MNSYTKTPFLVFFGISFYLCTILINVIAHYGNIVNYDYFRGSVETFFFAPLTFLITYLIFKRDDQARELLWILLIIGVSQALFAFLQAIEPYSFDEFIMAIDANTEQPKNVFLESGRVFGIWQHPPEFGGLMATLLPVNVYLISNSSGFKRVISILSVIIILLALFASGSITAILAGLFFMLFFITTISRQHFYKKILTIVCIFLVVMIVMVSFIQVLGLTFEEIPVVNRIFNPWSSVGVGRSGEARLIMYHAVVSLWRQSPLLGVGLGQFRWLQNSPFDLTAHSVYLQALVETGIIGVFGLLVLLVTLGWQNFQLFIYKIPQQVKNLYITFSIMCLIILVVSIFDFTFYKWNFQLIFWTVQGIVVNRVQCLKQIHDQCVLDNSSNF